mgnify:CR=1 FL=1
MVGAGIWAMISPWVLGFSSISLAKWNSLILGLIVILVNVWIIFDGTATAAEASSAETGKGRANQK